MWIPLLNKPDDPFRADPLRVNVQKVDKFRLAFTHRRYNKIAFIHLAAAKERLPLIAINNTE